MLSTKTKEHIRRRMALLLPRWGVLLASIGMLGGAVVFTGEHLQVVEVTDTHGNYSLAITSAGDVQTLLQQTGITPPQGEDDLVITEEDGRHRYHILRAFSVEVNADGEVRNAVVTDGTVGEAIQEAGLSVGENDIVEPSLDTAVAPGMEVTIQRVEYREYSQEEVVPAVTEYDYTSLYYRDQDEVTTVRQGSDGLDRVTYRETYIDGELTDTQEVGRETVTAAVSTILKCYGESAPVSDFVGPEIVDGQPSEGVAAVYSGKRSTGYSASSTARGASGERLTYGSVAVDPSIIPYGTLMYITSDDGQFVYGYAYAADTGTALMTGHAFVDLYYETYDESVESAVIPVTVYVIDDETAAQYEAENDAILAEAISDNGS